MYPLLLHKHLNTQKWATYPFDRQILMIANEVNRYMNGMRSDLDEASQQECLERIFELCDLTIACQTGSRRKELSRWRELVGGYYVALGSSGEFHADIRELAKVLLLNTRTTEALI